MTIELLTSHLEKNEWEEADSCTKSLIREGDLKTIDELWTKYSDGRFGFSIQSQIWKELGGKELGGTYDNYRFTGVESGDDAPDSHYDLRSTYESFASRVGWNDTLSNSDIPSGHYPKRYAGNNRYATNNISVLCRYITKINEIHRGEKRKALIADQGVSKYGKSKFHSGQKVIFSMKCSRYDGCVGTVKRAINSAFVVVEFDDGYETIQGDRRFEPIGSA